MLPTPRTESGSPARDILIRCVHGGISPRRVVLAVHSGNGWVVLSSSAVYVERPAGALIVGRDATTSYRQGRIYSLANLPPYADNDTRTDLSRWDISRIRIPYVYIVGLPSFARRS